MQFENLRLALGTARRVVQSRRVNDPTTLHYTAVAVVVVVVVVLPGSRPASIRVQLYTYESPRITARLILRSQCTVGWNLILSLMPFNFQIPFFFCFILFSFNTIKIIVHSVISGCNDNLESSTIVLFLFTAP